MGLIDRLMRAWAKEQRRTSLCAYCHDQERRPGDRYCSEDCARRDADEQALSF